MFSRFFIERPIFATVIAFVILLVGSFAIVTLPVERYPNIAPPTITVSAFYPGADAQTVADTVAAPIEQEVNGVENMIYMSSVSAGNGSMGLTVTFETGTDLDMANVLTQNRVSTAESKLPQEVQRMGVTVKKKSTDANLFVGFVSDDPSHDDLFLANYITLNVKDELARVPGVGEVMVFGVGDFSMRLWLDPDRMRLRGVTAEDVVAAVRDQNVQVAAGTIGEPPVPAGQSFQYSVNVAGRLSDPEEFGNIVVRTGADGRMLRVRDVADIRLGASSYTMKARLNGRAAATLAVYQIPGANAIQVVDGVTKALDEMSSRFPDKMEHRIVYRNSDIIKASLKEVIVTLFITLALVVFTVYIFLQDARTTLIPSLTIPVSLIGTFAAMQAMGFSINQFTLFGLVLVIGIVVDDAIVVVENVSRYLEEGLAPKEAATRAMSEISGAVIATTLVLLSVFVPTAFMPGITGLLFRQFALTISVATCFSTLNALTLSPALCGVLLKRPDPNRRVALPLRLFNTWMDRTTHGYTKTVQLALRRSVLGLMLFAGLTAAAFIGFGQLPAAFVPQEDEGYCMVTAMLPDAASQERMVAFQKQVEQIVMEADGVRDCMSVAGFSIIDGAVMPNAGFCVVTFEHWDERGKEEHQSRILQGINMKLARLQAGTAMAFPMPSLPGVGVSGGLSMQLQDRSGAGASALAESASGFIADGNAQDALTGMYSTFRANVPQLFVDIDRDQVLSKGIPMGAVFSAMQTFLGSTYINDLTLFGRVYQVKAQAQPQFRMDSDQIRSLEVRTASGKMLPLGSVATVRNIVGPVVVNRYNMYPAAKILAQPGAGFSSGDAMGVVEDMQKQKLSDSMGLEWTELSYQEKVAQGASSIIFVLAVLMVYLVLAAQYESWTLPISVCLAVPTALLGAVIALVARGMSSDVYAQVGVVLLIGLSTKTAILIVEFAKTERESGKSAFDAALSAARLRFRAVLMTAFSFILGVLPLLVASGAGAESRKVLGTTVFGGMLVATVMSLIFVPMLYFVVQKLSERVSGVKGES